MIEPTVVQDNNDDDLEEGKAASPISQTSTQANSDEDPSNNDEGLTDSNDDEDDPPEASRNKGLIKKVVAVLLLAFLAFVISDSLTNKYIRQGMNSFLEWIEMNPVGGIFVFAVVIFFTTLLFIPGVILTLGAGYAFGVSFSMGVGILLGTLSFFVGASAGAILSFLLGRFLLRDCVQGLASKMTILQALDTALGEPQKGRRIMVLLRLSPLMYVSPYLNYGAGGTAVSFSNYACALLATLPTTVMYVFLGSSAGSLADSSGGGDSTTTLIVLIVGIVFSVIAVGLASYYTRQELNKIVEANRQGQERPIDENLELVRHEESEEIGNDYVDVEPEIGEATEDVVPTMT